MTYENCVWSGVQKSLGELRASTRARTVLGQMPVPDSRKYNAIYLALLAGKHKLRT